MLEKLSLAQWRTTPGDVHTWLRDYGAVLYSTAPLAFSAFSQFGTDESVRDFSPPPKAKLVLLSLDRICHRDTPSST